MVGIGLPVREVARHGSIARTLDQCRVKHGGSSTRLSEAYCSGGTRGQNTRKSHSIVFMRFFRIHLGYVSAF